MARTKVHARNTWIQLKYTPSELNQTPSAKLLDLQPVSHKDTALAGQGHSGFSG